MILDIRYWILDDVQKALTLNIEYRVSSIEHHEG